MQSLRCVRFCLIAVFLSSVVSVCLADTVTKTDGTSFEGQIVDITPDGVVHIKVKYGVVAIPKDQIKTVVRAAVPTPPSGPENSPGLRDVAAGPRYYALPMIGEIGVEVSSSTLEKAFKAAALERPDVIVLCIDSPGGRVSEIKPILDLIADVKKPRLVAYVSKALSAAAIIAMACPEICMAPDGTIGAAVPYQLDSQGTAKDVNAKYKSVFLAMCRSAAERGKHSPLLARGMADPDIRLVVTSQDGKPKVSMEGSGDVIKQKGEVLTLSANEAVGYGLAVGIASELEEVRRPLGMERWCRVEKGMWHYVLAEGKRYRKREDRDLYFARIAPELEQMDGRLEVIAGELRTIDASLADHRRVYDAEAASVEEEYERTMKVANLNAVADPNYAKMLRRRAEDTRYSKLSNLTSRFQPQVLNLKRRRNELLEEQGRLMRARKKLLEDSPN